MQSLGEHLCRKYIVQSLDKHLFRKYSVQILEKQLRREDAVNVKIANAEHPYIQESKKIITLPFFLSKCKSFCCKNHRLSPKQVYGAFLRQQKPNSSGKAVLRPPENVYSLLGMIYLWSTEEGTEANAIASRLIMLPNYQNRAMSIQLKNIGRGDCVRGDSESSVRDGVCLHSINHSLIFSLKNSCHSLKGKYKCDITFASKLYSLLRSYCRAIILSEDKKIELECCRALTLIRPGWGVIEILSWNF